MWDMLVRTPRGRISTRKYLSVAATFLVVCFAYIFVTAPTIHAADSAQWQGSDIVYQQNTYSGPTTAKGNESYNLPKDTQIYTYIEGAGTSGGGSTQKAYLIYFPSGTDPTTATTAKYQTYDLKGQTQYSNPSQPTDITLTASAASPSTTTPTTSCAVDGVGWIVCSMSRWIADGVDYLYGILSNFFIVQPLTSTSPTNSIYSLWQPVRNVANVAFVIAFLIIIYSQLTSNALSNYTVKKMIPRIIVAAILVNTSYWICAAAIDVSNILGVAIQDLLTNLRQGIGAANTVDLPKWGDVTAGILSGGGVAIGGGALLVATGGTVGGLVFLLLGALLPAIFAALVAVAILAARQALITVFVIIAPLAFVAYLLPNTEEWFNRWRKLFMTALIMFPAFSLIFGAAQLTGVIIIQNAHDITVALLGLTVQVVPLFITPFLIKLSSGLLGTIAGIANDRSKGVFDRTKNWAGTNRELHRQRGFSTRPRQGVQRLRPTNVARGLNNRSLRREGMTAAHKSVAEGRFTQTAGGRRVHDRKKNAELYKHAGDADNLEAYNNALYGTPGVPGSGSTYRQELHHQAHLASGRAKLVEDRATAHAERDLQTGINSTAALRDLKIQTDVDSAHAKLQTASVEADAKLEFQNQVDNSRALKVMKVATFVAEQQATSIDSRLTKNAEARWNQLSRTDVNLQELRLQEVQATDSAKRVEEQWNSMLANIRATGSSAPYLAPQNTRLADSIKGLAQDLSVEAEVQESAKTKQQEVLATELKANAALRMYAGGVTGASGAARVFAKARSGLVSAYMENVKNQRSTLSEYSLNELLKLSIDGQRRDGTTATDEEIDAAYQEVLLTKGNNWAFQKLKDNVREKGMHYDENTNKYYNDYDRATDTYSDEITDSNEIERRRTQQQIFVDAANQSKLKIASLSGTDRGDMETGTFTMSSEDAIIRDIREKKINANRLANTDIDELMRTVQVLRDDTARTNLPGDAKMALQNTIEFALTDPQVRASIDDRAAEIMGVIHSYVTDDRSVIPLADKQAYEDLASTKVFTNYDPRVPYDPRNDPRGPA